MGEGFQVLSRGGYSIYLRGISERLARECESLSIRGDRYVAVGALIGNLPDLIAVELDGPEGARRFLFRLEVDRLAIGRPDERFDPIVEACCQTADGAGRPVIKHNLPLVRLEAGAGLVAVWDVLAVGGIPGESVGSGIRSDLLSIHRGEIDFPDLVVRAPGLLADGYGGRGVCQHLPVG